MNIREIKQKEFTEKIIENNYNHIYIISPRVGKTKLVLDSLKGKEHRNIVISVPRETIIDSWNNEIEKWKSSLKPNLICHNSLSKITNSVDLLIVDECQTLSPKQIEIIKSLKIPRLLFITGTLNKENQELYKREFNLDVKVNYPIDEAIKDGIIADYEINIVKCKLTDVEKKEYDKLTDTFNYVSNKAKLDRFFVFQRNIAARKRMFFIYNNESKVKKVKEFINNLDERYILFSANTKVSEKLSNNRFDSKAKNKNLDKFINKEINDLGVIRMIDMGITIPDLKLGIIQQIQSNEEIFLQRALRCCNLDKGKIAKIYIFVCENTVDENWLQTCLKDIDNTKIKYLN